MPYIDPIDRTRVATSRPTTAGELNYALTMRCLAYLSDKGTSYATVNEIVGALECAKQEFYRRVAVPYEDKKLRQNGDVYPVIP